jgi:hypothetical protein
MHLNDITPYITAYGPLGGLLVAADYFVLNRHKKRITDFLLSVAWLTERPRRLSFYFFIGFTSAALTLVILFLNGVVQQLSSGGSLNIGFKSVGPILLAVIFKVLVFDYWPAPQKLIQTL